MNEGNPEALKHANLRCLVVCTVNEAKTEREGLWKCGERKERSKSKAEGKERQRADQRESSFAHRALRKSLVNGDLSIWRRRGSGLSGLSLLKRLL